MLPRARWSVVQCGRHITEQEIPQIRETVDTFGRLSRTELAETICEHPLKAQRKERKRVQRRLPEELRAQGLSCSSHGTISNHKSQYEAVEQERTARNEAIAEHVGIFCSNLPMLLKRLSKIEVAAEKVWPGDVRA